MLSLKKISHLTSHISPLLTWYRRHQRSLPWRGQKEPYRIWLSEVMLQQTMVATVIPYYEKFLKRWPALKDLAAAPLEDVLHEWAGLGYYSRARNLHKCAQYVIRQHQGRFPDNAAALKKLPGIGAYTAGAIAAIAFDEKAAAVDGNVVRVLSRIFGIAAKPPQLAKDVTIQAQLLMDQAPDRSEGDLVQALMELGATLCTPRKPDCLICPVRDHCIAFQTGQTEILPMKAGKAERPTRIIKVFVAGNGKGNILLTRRPINWMLGGMLSFPCTALTPKEQDHVLAIKEIKWHVADEYIKHSFTHFDALLQVHEATIKNYILQPSEEWIEKGALGRQGLPTLFAKVMKIAELEQK